MEEEGAKEGVEEEEGVEGKEKGLSIINTYGEIGYPAIAADGEINPVGVSGMFSIFFLLLFFSSALLSVRSRRGRGEGDDCDGEEEERRGEEGE